MARRTSDNLRDRRFTPYVYYAFQCPNAATVGGNDLCQTCIRHEYAYSKNFPGKLEWHGFVSDPISDMPETSHIAGSPWYMKRLQEGTLLFGEERAKTACQEGRFKVAQRVPEAELKRFARHGCDLNIERLYQTRQLWKKDLCFILTELGHTVRIDSYSGGDLCNMIRKIMDPPTLEVIEAEATEAEAIAVSKAKKVKTVNWAGAPGGERVCWAHKSDNILYGFHTGKGAITGDDGVKHKTPSGFAVHEFKKLQAAGIIPADMVASVNGWYGVRIQLPDYSDRWMRFTELRT